MEEAAYCKTMAVYTDWEAGMKEAAYCKTMAVYTDWEVAMGWKKGLTARPWQCTQTGRLQWDGRSSLLQDHGSVHRLGGCNGMEEGAYCKTMAVYTDWEVGMDRQDHGRLGGCNGMEEGAVPN